MTFEELVNDAKIADDMELTYGDTKFKMGELRQADKSRKAKEHKLAEELATAAKKQKELTDLATEAAALVEKLKTEPAPARKTKKDDEEEIDFDTDPLYSPLYRKLLKPLQDKQAEFDNAIKALNSSIADSAKFLLSDYYDRRWRDIPADKRPKDKGWKDYVKIAADKKILNEFNLPDPVEAFNREIEPVEKDNLSKQLADANKKIEELQKAASQPRMPRPGAAGVARGGENKAEKTFTTVDEMIDAAFNDPTIQEIAGRA